jgi:hypothetical protein
MTKSCSLFILDQLTDVGGKNVLQNEDTQFLTQQCSAVSALHCCVLSDLDLTCMPVINGRKVKSSFQNGKDFATVKLAYLRKYMSVRRLCLQRACN